MAEDENKEFLTVQILGSARVNCFRNANKKNPKEPDFRGDGVAIWINQKKLPEANNEKTA